MLLSKIGTYIVRIVRFLRNYAVPFYVKELGYSIDLLDLVWNYNSNLRLFLVMLTVKSEFIFNSVSNVFVLVIDGRTILMLSFPIWKPNGNTLNVPILLNSV
jgi:hypothetical protein